MQNILDIGRIATAVSGFLSKEDLKSFGLVNTTCNFAATRLLWQETSLRRALDLLSATVEQQTLELDDVVQKRAEERFVLCCTSVRTVYATTDDKRALKKAQKHFRALTGNSRCLFPGLRCLKWTVLSEKDESWDVDYLLSRSLRQLWIVTVSSFNPNAMETFGSSLSQRAPFIQVLRIDAPWDADYKSEVYTTFMICSLQDLNALYIPGFMAKNYLVEELLKMPKLHIVHTLTNPYEVDGFFSSEAYPARELNKEPPRRPENTSLWKSFTCQDVPMEYPLKAMNLFNAFKFPCLTYLALNPAVPGYETRNPGSLADVLACSVPSLQTLIIGSERTIALTSEETVDWKVVQKILKCKNLTTLEVYSWKVSMTSANLHKLAKNRSTWKSLVIFTDKGFEFRDLLVLAEHCPNLGKLGLRFHGLSTIPVVTPYRINPKILFPCLREIHFANTYVVKDQRLLLGLFLSVICRKPLKVTGFYSEIWGFVKSYTEFLRDFICSPDMMILDNRNSIEKRRIPEYKIEFLDRFKSEFDLCIFLKNTLTENGIPY